MIRQKLLAIVYGISCSTALQAAVITVDHAIPEPDGTVYPVNSYYAPESGARELHIIGIYECQPGRNGIIGEATVHIRHDGLTPMKPIDLVLSSYEPVRWIMDIESDANVRQIVLNGYYEHEIVGAGNIPLRNRSPIPEWLGSIILEWPETNPDNSRSELVVEAAERIAGVPLTSFTGNYRADEFTLLGTPVPEPSSVALYVASCVSTIMLLGKRHAHSPHAATKPPGTGSDTSGVGGRQGANAEAGYCSCGIMNPACTSDKAISTIAMASFLASPCSNA